MIEDTASGGTTTLPPKTGPWWDPYNTGTKKTAPSGPTTEPTGPWWDPYNTGTKNPPPPTTGPVLDPVITPPTTIQPISVTPPVIKPADGPTVPTTNTPAVDQNAAILAALASLYPSRAVESTAPYGFAPTGGGQVESASKNKTVFLLLAIVVAGGAFWYYKKHKKGKAPASEAK